MYKIIFFLHSAEWIKRLIPKNTSVFKWVNQTFYTKNASAFKWVSQTFCIKTHLHSTEWVKHFLQVWRDSDTQMLDGGGVAWNLNCRQARKVYNCTLCSYRTPSRSDIDKHIRTHTGEKPFSCPHCLYQTANKSNLKRHMRTHTAENIHLWPIVQVDS